MAQCERTLVTTADVTPEAIKRLVEAFEAFGVSKEQIELRIQRRLDAVQPAQVANLRKIYASIRDGMSTADEWFEKPATKSRSVESLIELESSRETEQLPVNAELPPDPYGEWIGKIEICQTIGDIAKLLNEMPANVKADLKELVTKRQDDIKAQTQPETVQ